MRGTPRFGPGAGSDLEFRTVHRIPSIDCVLARARLTYLGRLVRARPPSLSAVLRQRPSRNGAHQLSAWLQLVIQDQRRLRQSVALCSGLPDPEEDPQTWCTLICGEPLKWKQAVALLHFEDSIWDKVAHERSSLSAGLSLALTARPHSLLSGSWPSIVA